MIEVNTQLLNNCDSELKSLQKKVTDELKRAYPDGSTVYVFINRKQRKPSKATVTGSYSVFGEVNVLLDGAMKYRARRTIHFTKIQYSDHERGAK